jgi:hypothetical protein
MLKLARLSFVDVELYVFFKLLQSYSLVVLLSPLKTSSLGP